MNKMLTWPLRIVSGIVVIVFLAATVVIWNRQSADAGLGRVKLLLQQQGIRVPVDVDALHYDSHASGGSSEFHLSAAWEAAPGMPGIILPGAISPLSQVSGFRLSGLLEEFLGSQNQDITSGVEYYISTEEISIGIFVLKRNGSQKTVVLVECFGH